MFESNVIARMRRGLRGNLTAGILLALFCVTLWLTAAGSLLTPPAPRAAAAVAAIAHTQPWTWTGPWSWTWS
jgi:hypothetical protein